MYVVHTRWEDLIAHTKGSRRACYVEPRVIEKSLQGIPTELLSSVLVTMVDVDGLPHAGRLFVERASILGLHGTEEKVSAVVWDRVEQAVGIVTRALEIEVHRGFLLTPGLWDDMMRVHTSHSLWDWRGDKSDPLARQLVPAGEVQHG